MVYYGARKNRRYNRKRNNRLSNRRIYSRTSAKSQASQIATLRNRMNKVYKACRPEIKVRYNNATSFTFDSQTLLNTYKAWLVTMPALGSGDNQRIGDKIYVKNIQLNFTFEYYNSSATGYHNSESAGTTMRIIVGKYKDIKDAVPTIDGVLQESSNTGSAYTNQAVVPLKNEQTAYSKILLDKRFTITTNNNQKIMRLNIRPGTIRFKDIDANAVWVMVVSAGLHNDNNFSEFVKGTFSNKVAFTDA